MIGSSPQHVEQLHQQVGRVHPPRHRGAQWSISHMASLTTARRRLLAILQQVSFGRLESLVIRDGEPVLDPMPRKVRQIKFGGDDSLQSKLGAADFQLKCQVVELFEHFDEIRDGVIDVLEVQHGLPFRMTITEERA